MPLVRGRGGKLLREPGGSLTFDLDCCCTPNLCCDEGVLPAFVVFTIEDIDDALEDHPLNGDWMVPGNNIGGGVLTGSATDQWSCDNHDADLTVECVNGQYQLTIYSASGEPWPGVDPGLVVPATSVSCDPLEIVFEFTSDVVETFCWSPKTGKQFRVTVTESP